MKTLDYLHLEAGAAGKVVVSLQQLLADFQVHYMNLRGFHWNIKGHGFFRAACEVRELYGRCGKKKWARSPNVSFSSAECLRISSASILKWRRSPKWIMFPAARGSHTYSTIYGYLIAGAQGVGSVASQAGDEVTVSMLTDYLANRRKWSGCSPHTLPAVFLLGK